MDNKNFRLAFGLSKHPHHGYLGLIGKFARHVDALTYWDFYDDLPSTGEMAQHLLDLMHRADRIFFNLDGMLDDSWTIADLVTMGAEGPGAGNWTMWEFYTIMSNDLLLSKTTFYRNGQQFVLE